LRRGLSILLLACAALGRAEIIDRVAVSVGNRVITQSDLVREIRVTAFLNGTEPDLGGAGKRKTAARMVDQRLVRRELELSRYPEPAPAEAEPAFEKLKAERFSGREEALRAALAGYGISEQDLKDELLWQLTFLRFVDVRFRPGVQLSTAEIRDYFDRVVRPAAEAAQPGRRVTLAQFRDQIEQTLTGQRVDRELNAWLEEARRRTPVEYREEALR
jgi:hypothetical protein